MARRAPTALPKKRRLPEIVETAAPLKRSRFHQAKIVHRQPVSETASINTNLHNLSIYISDDEDADEVANDRLRRSVPSPRPAEDTNRETGSARNATLHDLEVPIVISDDEDASEDNTVQLQSRSHPVQHTQVAKRNFQHRFIAKGVNYTAGTTVELNDGTFLRIKTIWEIGTGQMFVAGDQLVRTAAMELKMELRTNELVWKQGLRDYETPASRILRTREVIFTNREYRKMSLETDFRRFANQNHAKAIGPLFCRWKTIAEYSRTARVQEESIVRLRHDDADNKVRRNNIGENIDTRIEDVMSRLTFRNDPTQDGGSHTTIHTEIDEDGETRDFENRSYCFGDGFCGAGGASRGALSAGLFVKWGFDMDDKAMKTYRSNFSPGGTDCRKEPVDNFLERVQGNPPFVDVLHLSPPCQPFSPAHTIDSPVRDEANEAAMFAACQMLERMKPRIVTIEETFGLESRHEPFFKTLIRIITTEGYSVRWAVLGCQYYGVPQMRKRLVIIASAPGEILPPFPKPTHGSYGVPLVTINDKIAGIPRGAPDHVVVFSSKFKPKTPYSGNSQAKTITCAGGEGNHHPSGVRPFTIREAASLQTFPMQHTFGGGRKDRTAKRTQIGNAWPPVMAQAVYRTIIKSLKETDGVA